MARLQQSKQAAVTTGKAGATGIPCTMVYGLYEFSPVSGLDSHRGERITAHLTSASGGQDHTISPSTIESHV
jgi:hypothetical protein